MPTYMNHPMQQLLNIVPVLTGCDPSKTTSNCSCTDPSYKYSKPCTLSSTSTSTPIKNSRRTKCYYGTSPTNPDTISPSTGGGLAQKAKSQFTVKPNNTERQPFTQKDNVQSLISGSDAFNTYPNSLLFCSEPEENATSALPTSDTPDLSYTNNKLET